MQFKIEKETFLKALGRVQGIVEKRNTIPILSNVLIETTAKEICLTATDLEVGIRSAYPATVFSPGKVTVSAKKIHEIIKELPEQDITFTAKDNCWIEIRCGKSLFNIVGLAADDFPCFPYPTQENFLSLNSQLLKEMIEKTSFSISNDESKFNLNGIFFKTLEDNGRQLLRLVATDGHRLAMIQRPLAGGPVAELSRGVIFPRKGINELKKIAEEGESDILLGFRDNNAIVKKNQTVVVMRLVDGDFPDYNRVIPKANDLEVLLSSDAFFHTLRRMAILSSEKSRGVKIQLRPGSMEISSSNPELGDAREDLDVGYEGPELSIGFNARYLLDILQVMDEKQTRLMVKDHLSPGLLTPAADQDFMAVVMPMRL